MGQRSRLRGYVQQMITYCDGGGFQQFHWAHSFLHNMDYKLKDGWPVNTQITKIEELYDLMATAQWSQRSKHMKHQDGVITGNAVIIWDGFTTPEEKDGKYKQWTLSVVLPNNDPTLAELQEILTNELNTGMFKGQFPNGGHWGIKPMDPTQYEGRFPAHSVVKAVTYTACQVFGPDNKPLDPMMYAGKIYSGAVVNLFVTPRSYATVSKGIGFWLSGIRLIDSTTPRIAGVGQNASAAFGAAPVVGAPAAPALGAPGQAAPAAPQAPAVPGQLPAGPPAVGMAAPAPAVPGITANTPGVVPNAGFMTVPGVPVAPAAPPAPAAPVRTMTALANGATYEAMLANGWTDALLIQHGYMTVG